MKIRSFLMAAALCGASGAFIPARGQDASRAPAAAQSGASAARAGSAFSDYQRFQEPALRPWRQANQDVADNPGMGSMGSMSNMPGTNAPATGAKPGAAAGGHSMAGMEMPGMPSKAAPGAAPGAMSMAGMAPPPRGATSKPRPSTGTASAMPGMAGMSGMGGLSGTGGMPGDHNMGSMPNKSAARTSPQGGAGAAGASRASAGMAAMPGIRDKSTMGALPEHAAAAKGKDETSKPPMAAGGHEDAPGAHGRAGGGTMAPLPGMSGAGTSGSKAEAASVHGRGGSGGSMGAMPGMGSTEAKSGEPANPRLAGTGTVKSVDKAAGRVKLTHDPIAAAGWPGMTITFRLSDVALADRVQAGDKVSFTLSQSASGYVISELLKGAPSAAAKETK